MNKLFKILIINITLLISFTFNFYNNFSYGQCTINTKNEFIYVIVKENCKNENTRTDNVALENSNSSYIKGIWPLEKYSYVSSGYGYRTHPITKKLSFHNGIDIPAPKNTNVLASDDGIVVFAGYKKGYGNVVEIDHFDSKKTLYAHNNSINVKVGDEVKRGDVISKVGSTGNSTGNHVHFEVKINNKRINPIYGVSKN